MKTSLPSGMGSRTQSPALFPQSIQKRNWRAALTVSLAAILSLIFGPTVTSRANTIGTAKTQISMPTPDGVTNDGLPYYYVYPDEGYDDSADQAAPNYANNNPTDEAYPNESSDLPYNNWWGLGYGAGFDFNGGRNNGRFHHNHHAGTGHGTFNHNIAPRQNSGRTSFGGGRGGHR
jgi:hypothetical protein